MKLFLTALLLFCSSALADSATQSDWSGGPWTPGPVSEWGLCFSSEASTSWAGTPGSVCIGHTTHGISTALNDACFVCSGDMDGDGDVDVLGAGGENLSWWENADGLGTEWIAHEIWLSYDANSLFADDLDGDGDIDVLATFWYWGSGGVVWFENNQGPGDPWIDRPIASGFAGASSVCSSDIDGDGNVDVLGAAMSADDITWWENEDGIGTDWLQHPIDGSFDGACSVHAEDIDGDGDIDVLGAAYNSSDIAWWENADSQGTAWVKHMIDESFVLSSSVGSADVDGDGDVDVLGAGDDEIAWWENVDGLGTLWAKHAISGVFDGAISVYPSDLDSDGDIDVLGAAFDADEITWWENGNGQGSSWIEHTIQACFGGAHCVCSDDIDGDGNLDVLGASFGGEAIYWWDLTSYPSTASLESSILYTGCDPDWGTFLWSSQTPPGTSVTFQVRASDDYSQMGAWSDTLVAACSLHGILSDNASYVQYRSILTTANPDTTPTLLDVTVTWNPLGTGEGEGPATFVLLPFSPNPMSGPIVVSFGLPSATAASFLVFDVSGRVVAQEQAVEYSAGYQQIQLGELPSGIYICRMRAGSFTATQRFVMLE